MRTLPTFSIALTLVAVAACSSTSDQSPDYGPLVAVFRADTASTLLLSGSSGFRAPATLVVTDEATWSDIWAQAQAPYEPKDPAPGIDFGEDGVIVAALGTMPNGGYGISIDSVEFFATGQKVYLTRSSVTGCIVTQALTSPVHMVRVPRPLGNVTFEERSSVKTCS